jgi:xanthine dehydrogenase YagT iron-sulfur-binding subunit
MKESRSKKPSRGGFSRRDFLRGSGAAAAAATALATGQAVAADAAGPKVVRGATTITLDVNGKSHKVSVEPRTTLLDALRYQLDLTGAKPVSMDGSSGASTVLVDGKPMTASTLLAVAVEGKAIRTVESLGGDKPDAVPRAFVEHDAEQCGFCTPGFVVAVRAFLDKNPKATEAEIRHGLNGNLCRCGTYANIIHAAIAVVKGGGNG